MWSRLASRAALRMPRSEPGVGRVRPAFQMAVSTTASKPARWETATRSRANAGLAWASESSTTPTMNDRFLVLCGPGSGGSSVVVAGTAEVLVLNGGGEEGTETERWVVVPVVPVVRGAVVLAE
jgi:hypothetical protein